jgi:hypothetical protein
LRRRNAERSIAVEAQRNRRGRGRLPRRHGSCDQWLPARRRPACIRIPEKGRCLESFDEECRIGQQ